MKKSVVLRPVCLIVLICSCALGWGQDASSAQAFVRMRTQFKVQGVAKLDDLRALQETKVVEVRGMVKGTFKVGGVESLLVEQEAGGETLMLEAAALPGWTSGGEMPVRALAEASRPTEGGSLRLRLLAVIPESRLKPAETKVAQKRQRAASASRGGYERRAATQPTSASGVMPIYSNFIRRWNPRLSKKSADEIATCVIGFGLQRGIDPRLLMAVLMTESDFKPETTSRAGAMGLGQLMPVNLQELGLNNAYDTVQNLYGTATLIRRHIDKYRAQTSNEYDALVLALAGYNAGDGAVKKYGGVPPYRETQNYVRKVIGYYEQLIGYRIDRR